MLHEVEEIDQLHTFLHGQQRRSNNSCMHLTPTTPSSTYLQPSAQIQPHRMQRYTRTIGHTLALCGLWRIISTSFQREVLIHSRPFSLAKVTSSRGYALETINYWRVFAKIVMDSADWRCAFAMQQCSLCVGNMKYSELPH